jgi:hypothetical protein
MRTLIKTLFFFLLATQVCFAQIYKPDGGDNMLSFVYEDFEGTTFPPAGWTLEYTGTLYWQHSNQASGYGIGTSSAVFNNYWAAFGTTQSLVLESLGPTSAGDSITFDHAYTTFDLEVDRLIIETSNNGGLNYDTLVILNGGRNGPLTTAPRTTSYFIPLPTQWATKKYALPVGTNRVRFKAISAYGNNLYIDNCSIGSQLSVDVGVQSVDISNPTFSLPQIPKASVKNHGTTTQTFSVTMLISPGGYTSTKAVTSLTPNNVLQISFDEWTPSIGTYNFKTFTILPGDMDNSNDTVQITINVVQPQITNIDAFFRDGQVFVTWDNLQETNVRYTLYRSPTPIQYGYQLASSQNLGYVPDNSALNKRLSNLIGTTYLKIDSASAPLASSKGLFVATSTDAGSYYYAVTPGFNDLEDTTIIAGANSLSSPVSETVMIPKPVWQQNRTIAGKVFEIYVLFATKVRSSIFPQMTNAGTFPCNFALIKKGSVSPHPLTIYMHYGTSHFLSVYKTLDHPEEWIVSIDEWIPGFPDETLGYGYHEDYDIFSTQNPVPTSGLLYNYTAKKREFLIDWARRNLTVDTTRVYLTGFSLGAHAAVFDAVFFREKLAAMFLYDPCYDVAGFFADGSEDRLWGTYQTNLLTNEGYARNDRLNAKFIMSEHQANSLPLIFTFSGKQSGLWPEKPSVYDTIRATKHGGYHFWSPRDHWGTYASSPWVLTFPNFSFLTRYRTDLSYPAFSNCSMDNDPGDGNPSSGDALGSINGHLDWTDDIVDESGRWEITLFVKDLLTTSGTLTAPDSATTDVTLRRLQNFVVPSDSTIWWKNTRNGAVVQHGSFVYTGGLITLEGVQVFKDLNRIEVSSTPVSVEEQTPLSVEYVLHQNYPNPFNPSTVISYQLPVGGNATIKVYDLLGKDVATLINEEQSAGTYKVEFDANQLSSGIYFYQLKAGEYVNTKKMLLIK